MTDLRDLLAETEGGRRNGLASDGRGWYRTAADRQECYAVVDALLPILAAELARVRTQVAQEIAADLEAQADDEAQRPRRGPVSEAIEGWLREAAQIARQHAERARYLGPPPRGSE